MIPLANFRTQYAKNLVTMRRMLAKARTVAPRKYSGYSVSDLEDSVEQLEKLVAMTDDVLAEHLARVLANPWAEREATLARRAARAKP